MHKVLRGGGGDNEVHRYITGQHAIPMRTTVVRNRAFFFLLFTADNPFVLLTARSQHYVL